MNNRSGQLVANHLKIANFAQVFRKFIYMLNRRQIRIRALQAIYAFKRIEKANQDLAKDQIIEAFEPDLNSMEFQDKEKLNAQKSLCFTYFNQKVDLQEPESSLEERIISVGNKAFDFYKSKLKKDTENLKLQTLLDADAVHDTYLYILKLFVEIGEKSRNDEKLNGRSLFIENPILKSLKANETFEHLCLKRNISWTNDDVFLAKFYDILKKNDRYDEYINEVKHTDEEHLGILKYILKNVIFKHETCHEFFELRDLYWYEDIETLRAMCAHTFEKLLKGQKQPIEELDEQWREVRDFLKVLTNATIENERELNAIIGPKLKNWDLERVNETDEIAVKMSLIEMMEFPSIPVKVTINEAIEIARTFNTPKSGIFVNGILDSLSKELIKDGRIKKSGRGLIDNK